jgi:hypothetical protein
MRGPACYNTGLGPGSETPCAGRLPRWKKRDISGAMSGHGHHAGEAHADEHAHEDETTSDDFPADEPRSPGWLPLLGGALFLAGIFVFVAMGSSSKTTDELSKDAAAANPTASAAPGASVAVPMPSPAQRPAAPIPVGAQMPANHPPLPAGVAH